MDEGEGKIGKGRGVMKIFKNYIKKIVHPIYVKFIPDTHGCFDTQK